MKNFLVNQYISDDQMLIKHNYLREQFKDYNIILKKISNVVKLGHFTLGEEVDKFEKNIQKLINCKYVVAVGSGTDAIMLSLKALGVHEGDEVITTPYTFYATIGAIVTAGAKPVFVDVEEDYNLDAKKIEKKITKKTKAILPVHWSGRICDMQLINKISRKFKIPIVEDSCHAILAYRYNKFGGTFGRFGCFSMHPLKNLNIWGDGGFVILKKKKDYEKLKLLRNHGLIGRNINKIFAYNSRLDTVQAVVGNHLLKKIKKITRSRISNAEYFEKKFKHNKNIILKKKILKSQEVYHLFEFRVKNKVIRDKLLNKLRKNKIDAKIHYPIPMHLQPAARYLKYKRGAFPNCEKIADTTISLPVHEFIKKKELNYMIREIKNFFNEG